MRVLGAALVRRGRSRHSRAGRGKRGVGDVHSDGADVERGDDCRRRRRERLRGGEGGVQAARHLVAVARGIGGRRTVPLVMMDDLVVLAEGEAPHDTRKRAPREPTGQREHDQPAERTRSESHCTHIV